jgi:U4/U6 small nuclear ribonucleoprotein PRP31
MDSDLLDDLEELGGEEELEFDHFDQNTSQHEDGEQDLLNAMLQKNSSKTASIKDLTKTFRSAQLSQIVDKINGYLAKERSEFYNSGPAESDPEYQTIVQANNITVELIYEIASMAKVNT